MTNAKWNAEIHQFQSDVGNIRFGKEFDFGVRYPFRKGLTGKLDIAGFREGDALAPAGARKRDTDKLWLTLAHSYE